MVIRQKRKFKMLKKVLSLASLAALSCQLNAVELSVSVIPSGCDLEVVGSCYIQLAEPLPSSQNLASCPGYDYIRWESSSPGNASLMDTLSKLQSDSKLITLGLSDTECFKGSPKAVYWRNDNT